MKKIKGRNGGVIQILEKGDPALPGAGRVKGATFKTVALAFLNSQTKTQNPVTKKMENLTGMQQLFLSIAKVALNSRNDTAKISAIREILDRIEGKPTQPLDLSLSDKAKEVRDMFPEDIDLNI